MPTDPLVIRAGKRVRRKRFRLGLTGKQLGEKTGIAQSVVARFERGDTNVGLATAYQLATACGVTLDSLLAEPSCQHCDDDPPEGYICRFCQKEGA